MHVPSGPWNTVILGEPRRHTGDPLGVGSSHPADMTASTATTADIDARLRGAARGDVIVQARVWGPGATRNDTPRCGIEDRRSGKAPAWPMEGGQVLASRT